jgi:hypothetical protein
MGPPLPDEVGVVFSNLTFLGNYGIIIIGNKLKKDWWCFDGKNYNGSMSYLQGKV